MRTSELLNAMANWLASPDNEALQLAEDHDECLQIVAESCVLASTLLKQAAKQVDQLEPMDPSNLTPESVDELANLATALDASGDPALRKQASALDELLMTIAAPPDALQRQKESTEGRMEELRKKYQEPREDLKDENHIRAAEKAVEKSPYMKDARPLETPLSTRTCIEHPGAQLARVGENAYQCELDHKIFNYETGYKLNNGVSVPGSSVQNQTSNLNVPFQSIFDTRSGRLGYHE